MTMPLLLKGRRVTLLARLIGNGVTQAGAAIGTAFLIQLGFDQLITAGGKFDPLLLWVGAGLIGTAAVSACLRMFERVDAEHLGQDYVCEVRIALFDRLSMLAPRMLQKRKQGSLMLRFVGDLTALRQWVSLGYARLVVAGVMAAGVLLALAMLNTVLAAGASIVLFAGAVTNLLAGKQIEGAVVEARRRRSQLAANVSEKIASMAVVQLFGQARRERRRVGRQSRRLKQAMIARAQVTGKLRAIAEGTAAVATASTLLLGVNEVAAGRATPGAIVAAMAVVALLAPSLRDLGRTYEYWHYARVSRRKILEFLDMPAHFGRAKDATPLTKGAGQLVFDKVTVIGALRNFSAVAEPGQVVAVVGPNGAGKSTLLSLAARFIDPDHGEVRINGVNVADCELGSVRRAVGMVSPDLPLLRGTIRKNLRYRCRDASAEEIAQLKAACGIDEMLAGLPAGMETRITEGGKNLSLGQRQRISLARAIVGHPRILLLDEVDNNLDPRAGAALDRVLSGFDGTVLMVTHRVERLMRADVVWHLRDGELCEMGDPRVLMQGAGPTAELFQNQRMERAS